MKSQTTSHNSLLAVGKPPPDFCLVNSELKDVRLMDYAGKCKILTIVPRLDISTCMAVAQIFNENKVDLDKTVVLIISADSPFKQQRCLEMAGVRDVVTLSNFASPTFATDYGVQIVDDDLAEEVMTEAVVVIDEKNKVIFTQLTQEVAQELDYESIFTALEYSQTESFGYDSNSEGLELINRRKCFRVDISATNSCYCKIRLPVLKEDASKEYKLAYELALHKIQRKMEDELKQQKYSNSIAIRNKSLNNCMRLNLYDISSNGCSMISDDEEFFYFLTQHTIYENCTIVIPNHGEIQVSFKIMTNHKIGKFNELIGISFINVAQSVDLAISSYIQEIERQRMALVKPYIA